MYPFSATQARVEATAARHPAFPQGPALVVRLVKRIHKDMQDDANLMLKPYGLNHPEYNILAMLYGSDRHAMTPSEMALAAGEKSANITRLTDRLTERKLVTRRSSTEDRRKVMLTLTPRAEQLMQKLLPDVTALLLQQTRHLGEKELATLQRLLLKLLAGLEGD